MSASLPLATRIFPSRIADLGFSARLPTDWPALTLPEEAPDFSNPTLLVPLAIVMAPHAALIFSFAARPAYDDGTLFDWAQYLLNHNQLKPRAMGTDTVGGIPAKVLRMRDAEQIDAAHDQSQNNLLSTGATP